MDRLDQWLNDGQVCDRDQVCEHPKDLVVKRGTILVHGVSVQIYRCKACHRAFRNRKDFDFRMKNPRMIVKFARELSRKIDPAFLAEILLLRFGRVSELRLVMLRSASG